MADFGLAAQIGRGGGNAMPGAQPQDQTNRMMQMLQLQQLQQNMMLAREQEARQQQLFGPQLRGKEAELETEKLRQDVLRGQGRETGAKASSAEDALFGQRGVMKYISETPKELIADPKNLDVLRRTNAPAYTTITNMIAEKDALEARAKTENYTAGQKLLEQQALARKNMFSLLPAVTDQRSYDTLYSEYERVDPIGAKLIGREFNPKNITALSSRLMALDESEIKEDAFGRPYRLFKRTGQTEALPPVQPAAQAARRPAAAPESTFGNLSNAFAADPSSPQLVGAGAASIPSPNVMATPGATPIIQPRAPAFEGFGPAAAAAGEKATATERAKADVARSVKQSEQARELDRAIKEISTAAAPGGLISRSTGSGIGRAIDAAAAYFGGATPGAIAGAQLAPIADLALKMVPRFEGPQSDADRATYERAAGQIADTSIPNATRQAAARTVVRLMQERRNEFTVSGEGKTPARAVTRTGTLNGRRVVEYSDGKVEYAD